MGKYKADPALKWAHYSTHAKKRRTRKKYQKKLRDRFVSDIPPGVRVEVSVIPGPNGNYAVAIDYWSPPVDIPPSSITIDFMEVVLDGQE